MKGLKLKYTIRQYLFWNLYHTIVKEFYMVYHHLDKAILRYPLNIQKTWIFLKTNDLLFDDPYSHSPMIFIFNL